MHNKKAAFELSVTTIIIIVIGVTFLILGIVLVRNTMCGAVGLTSDVNTKVKGELAKLFGSTGGEVQCLGAGSDPIRMVPGTDNIVYCSIKAPQTAKYTITLKDYSSDVVSLPKSELQKWITTSSETWNVPPGDESPKKAVKLKIPKNAPEAGIRMQLEIKRDDVLISTQDVDFTISRLGFFEASMC